MDAAGILREKFTLREVTPDQYKTMGGVMMKFHLEQYAVEDLGNLCVLRTRAMLGLMRLVTAVITPSSGKNVPFLLIDTMDMGKKHLCYVEYYDCTASGADRDLLLRAGAPYRDLPDYREKPAWYIAEPPGGHGPRCPEGLRPTGARRPRKAGKPGEAGHLPEADAGGWEPLHRRPHQNAGPGRSGSLFQRRDHAPVRV